MMTEVETSSADKSASTLRMRLIRSILMLAGAGMILFVALPSSHFTGIAHPLRMALFGYVLTVAIEIPILLFALSPRHSFASKLIAGLWLTACTYPVVAWFIPTHLQSLAQGAPILLTSVRESFAAIAECILFWCAFIFPRNARGTKAIEHRALARDCAAIVFANLASFLTGELLKGTGAIWPMLSWFGLA